MLTKTFKAINDEFCGKDNAGLRDKLREVASGIVDGSNVSRDLLGVAGTVGLTFQGKEKLEEVNKVFLSEIR
jgi:hypothetical protein